MHCLILMDDLRQLAPWIAVVALAFVSGMMIWSPVLSKGWTRRITRVVGGLVLGFAILTAILFGFFAVSDSPRQHFVAISPDGPRAALLSHSELRDGAATVVTVAPHGCCTRFVAYHYFGDGDDYTGRDSIEWIDDHHLRVEYVRDASGTQNCASLIGDVVVTCIARSEELPQLP